MDPVENARSGNVQFFETAEVDEIQNARDESLNSVLGIAAASGRSNCCVVIHKRCPELLYIANRGGSTALHHASWNGNDDIVEFLISAASKAEVNAMNLLTMVTHTTQMTALHDAVSKDRWNVAKLLLEADPGNNLLLEMVDIGNNSAMHIAVKNHNLEIVKLLLETDPGFVYAPNNSGQTPHLIAVQESLSGDSTTVTIRRLLIERQPHGCTIKIGERGRTLLHHTTLSGHIKAIEDILEFSPISAELLDNEGQNYVHYAAKLDDERVLRYIMETNVSGNILNQQDINGNTPFHIVTSRGSVGMGLSMIYDARVDKFAINKKGKNALSAVNFDYDKRKAGVYGFIDKVDEKYLKDRSEFDLFVGALISTVSFTAGITVPGGYFGEGPNRGNAVLYKEASFNIFVISNTIALALSLYAVLNHFCTKHLINTDDIIFQLHVATNCSICSIFALMIAFISGSYAVLMVSVPLAVTVCILCFFFFCFSFQSIWRMRKQHRRTVTSVL